MEIHLSITRGHTIALFKIITLGLLLGFGIQFLFAWTAPSGAAPTGNVAGPLTTGNGTQTKAGGNLNLGSGGSLYAGGSVVAPQLCIGTDCRTTWPSGGGTTYTAGDGLSLFAGSIFSADTTYLQRRVSSTCAVGSSIRAINADGTVTCQTDNVGAGGGVTSVATGAGLTGGPITTTGTVSLNTAAISTCTGAGQKIIWDSANSRFACGTDQTGGGGGVGGSGTSNYIPRWTAGTTLGNSQIYQHGTNIVVGATNSLGYKLGVDGSVGVTGILAVAGNVTVLSGSSVTAPRFCIGTSCITSWPSGGGGAVVAGCDLMPNGGVACFAGATGSIASFCSNCPGSRACPAGTAMINVGSHTQQIVTTDFSGGFWPFKCVR